MTTERPLLVPDFMYGTAWKEERTSALTQLAVRAGFRAIDTANQRRHYLEAGVGEALDVLYRERLVTRSDLFLQTKFTYAPGQDHRLPYDPNAELATQVAQSMRSSLEHLRTAYVNSYVLHGPAGSSWTVYDSEVWNAMVRERDEGRTLQLGVSNVSLRHLQQMEALRLPPSAFVQNRCFARTGWDRHVRAFCRDRNIVYQGFSLLTANPEMFTHPALLAPARRLNAAPAQIVFRFARAAGILPLTGTSDPVHMKLDLDSRDLPMTTEEVNAIESAIG